MKIIFNFQCQGHVFESDSVVDFTCFETKVWHTLSHNGSLKSPWPLNRGRFLHCWTTSQLWNVPVKKKKDVPALTVLHITIHRCPEALSDFAQAYPEPHTTAVCQPSRNTKQTQNHGHTTGDSKQSMKGKKRPRKERRKCVKGWDKRWQIVSGKINTCPTLQQSHIFHLLCSASSAIQYLKEHFG